MEIEDKGPGFSKETLEHAFEPLWPEVEILEDCSVRSGLGLYFSRIWLEQCGGKIELGNRDQTGARVLITLPQRRKSTGK